MIKQYPDGYLRCHRNGKYIQTFQINKKKRKYISKKDDDLTKKLAYKRYLSCCIDDLENEQKALLAFQKNFKTGISSAEKLWENPLYHELLRSSVQPLSEELTLWANNSYESNPNYPQNLRHTTSFDLKVRSKSELLIAQKLFYSGIPFRYEYAFHYRNTTIYPDFTIRHPQSGEYIIWEHFGKMDSPEYAQNVFEKLKLYYDAGYIPSINLIITFETNEHPLDINEVEHIIEKYF